MTKIKLYKSYWDIVILPPVAISDSVISLSKELVRRYGGKFVLGQKRFLPHISLYHVPVRKSYLPKLHEELKKIVDHAKFGELSVKLEKVSAWDIVWLGVSNPSWLKRLHMEVVKRTKTLRDKRFRVEKTWSGKFSRVHCHNIKKYGSPFIESTFWPHITLTSLKQGMTDEETAEFMESAQFKPKRFKANSITVCRLGSNHTCHEEIFTIRKNER